MGLHFLKIALRNLSRNKLISAINILGLAVALSAIVLIFIYIRFEIGYDTFLKNADSIFRVSIISKREGKVEHDSPQFVPPLGPAMKNEIPGVTEYTRFTLPFTKYIILAPEQFKIRKVCYADSTFFNILSFNLINGNKAEVLKRPFTAVLTESTAGKLFGDNNPLERTVEIDNFDFEITGVCEDPPENSTVQFSILLSFESLYKMPDNFMGWNGGNRYITYVKLAKGASPQSVENKTQDILWRNLNKQLKPYNVSFHAYLQNIPELHLYYQPGSKGTLMNIFVFSTVAFLILIIAGINYINLVIGASLKRDKEIGIRKVIGAERRHLIKQFLTESLLTVTIAFAVALFLVELIFPYYRTLLGYDRPLSSMLTFENIAWLLGGFAVINLIGGLYPALYLSSQSIVSSLRNIGETGRQKTGLRNALVVFQFAISIVLINITIIVGSQIDFIKNKDLGFDTENLIIIPLLKSTTPEQIRTIKNEFNSIAGISSVTASSDIPYNGFTSNGYFPEGISTPMMINVVDVDPDFFKTYGLKIVEGKNFSQSELFGSGDYIVNETFVKKLGWRTAINKTVRRNGMHKIIGVVKDFHFANMYNYLAPLIITNAPFNKRARFLSVRINKASAEKIKRLKSAWERIFLSMPFEYSFLSDNLNALYLSDEKFRATFLLFAILACLLAIVGLLGITNFSIGRRVKEIGIRKVYGASAIDIINLILKEYGTLVLIGILIGSPFAFFFSERWLQNFAYKIELQPLFFLPVGLFVLAGTLLIVSFQVAKAALANPIDSLKYE